MYFLTKSLRFFYDKLRQVPKCFYPNYYCINNDSFPTLLTGRWELVSGVGGGAWWKLATAEPSGGHTVFCPRAGRGFAAPSPQDVPLTGGGSTKATCAQDNGVGGWGIGGRGGGEGWSPHSAQLLADSRSTAPQKAKDVRMRANIPRKEKSTAILFLPITILIFVKFLR